MVGGIGILMGFGGSFREELDEFEEMEGEDR